MVRRLLTAFMLLIIPCAAAAAPIVVFHGSENGSFDFDLIDARGSLGTYAATVERQGSATWFDLAGEFQTFNPFQSLFVGSNYSYGPGLLTFTGHWDTPSGTMTGGFTAPILEGLSFTVHEADLRGDRIFSDDAEAALGPGMLDPALAAYLGVKRQTVGGRVSLYVYGIEQDLSVLPRHGQIYVGASTLEIYAVPEPPIIASSIVVMLMALACRRKQYLVRVD